MEKMLVPSIFSISHNVFKRFLTQGRFKSRDFAKRDHVCKAIRVANSKCTVYEALPKQKLVLTVFPGTARTVRGLQVIKTSTCTRI